MPIAYEVSLGMVGYVRHCLPPWVFSKQPCGRDYEDYGDNWRFEQRGNPQFRCLKWWAGLDIAALLGLLHVRWLSAGLDPTENRQTLFHRHRNSQSAQPSRHETFCKRGKHPRLVR